MAAFGGLTYTVWKLDGRDYTVESIWQEQESAPTHLADLTGSNADPKALSGVLISMKV